MVRREEVWAQRSAAFDKASQQNTTALCHPSVGARAGGQFSPLSPGFCASETPLAVPSLQGGS